MNDTAERRPFETIGEKARWKFIYEFLRPMKKGTIIKYSQLSNVIGKDIRHLRTPIYRAMQELETNDNRSLLNIPNIGYRITVAQEHEGLTRHHHKKSKRQMKKALQKVTSADRSQLTREERVRFDAIELTIKQHAEMIKRLDTRVQKVEEKQIEQDDTSAKLDKLMAAMKRHGIEV